MLLELNNINKQTMVKLQPNPWNECYKIQIARVMY
jgi:hypothetical protein